jgi:hypothetical protein
LVAKLVELIAERNPPHLEQYLQYCLGSGLELSYLADCYLLLVADAVTEMMCFQREGSYRYSTFAEVGDHVYFDEKHMGQYMHRLAISLIFWPSHIYIHRFFEETLPPH